MYRLARAVLFLLPAETAHHLGLFLLRLLSALPGLSAWMRARTLPAAGVDLSVEIAGVRWPSAVGLAAGLDKDATAVMGLFGLGFGAVEVGTLTPLPQPGNPRPRLFRIPPHHALINRMGFNNRGASEAAERISRLGPRPAPLGINIGKNKDTPLERAADDYERCVDLLGTRADYLVINASSPNTPGLRQLQEPQALSALLLRVRTRLNQVAPRCPLFLKIAPDLAPEAVDEIVDVAIACGLDGLIATNTTLARPFEHPVAREAGGLSGAPVREAATAVIRRAYQRAAGRLPIIGVGGIFTAEDAYQKLRAGAAAVQVYTGFIYEGPGMVRRLHQGLAKLLERDGFRSLREVIGLDAKPSSPGATSLQTQPVIQP